MIVVGENLKTLVEQYGVVDNPRAFDHSSLTLRMARKVKAIEPPTDNDRAVVYGDDIPEAWIKEKDVPDHGYLLRPQECVLACSVEKVSIPVGYMGFVQTKGSLARLFVTVHCCDAQIDPGFKGNITFEIVNLGPLRVKIRVDQEIAQLFIVKTTTKDVALYQGRYQDADGPTHFKKKL